MKIRNTIYLDHQATTPLDARVLAAMTPYFAEKFGNPHSADHAMGWTAAQAIRESAEKIAALIGADADEIVFTSGATEANNLALLGLARRAMTGKRRRVLYSSTEHKSVLATARALHECFGFTCEPAAVTEDGRINLDLLHGQLGDDVLLVSVALVNNEIGTIQDIQVISQIVRAHGALLHCDGAQAPCAMDLTSVARHVDFLSLSAHKMYGPKGIGALFISHPLHTQIEPLIYGGGQQGELRSGTLPTSLCVGMGVAATLFLDPSAETERSAVRSLRDSFTEGVIESGWPVRVNGSLSFRHPGNVNICFEGFAAADILATLQPRLAASTGSACTSGIPEPSHVLRAIGLSEDGATSSIRFSVGRHTTADDIGEAIALITDTLKQLTTAGIARSA